MMFSEDELGRRSIAAPLDAIGAPEPGPQRPKSHLIMMFSEDELGRRSIAAPLDAIGAPEPGPQRVDQRFGAIISLRQFFWLWRV
jgi:hypothetical protein